MVVQALVESGTKTVTIAPEAGSERMRRYINKGVTEEDCFRAADLIGHYGVRQVKMYFMVGLPTETEEDIVAMADLAQACKVRLDRQNPGTQMTLNVSPFVPKPVTPLQWAPMTTPALITSRLNLLRSTLKPKGIKVRADSPEWYWIEGILSRGDRRVGRGDRTDGADQPGRMEASRSGRSGRRERLYRPSPHRRGTAALVHAGLGHAQQVLQHGAGPSGETQRLPPLPALRLQAVRSLLV